MEIRRAMNISFTADSFDHAVSMLHEVVEGPYRCLIEDLSIQDDKDLENEELEDIRIHPVAVAFQLTYFETRYDAESEEGLELEPEETQAPSGLAMRMCRTCSVRTLRQRQRRRWENKA